jgi:hypothetical protein
MLYGPIFKDVGEHLLNLGIGVDDENSLSCHWFSSSNSLIARESD